MRPDLPTGTVTFLFTDVEGSTRLLHELGAELYAEALAEHRRVIREACSAKGGVEVDTQGDAFFFAFPTAPGALSAAVAFTEALTCAPIRVRVGLHTGAPLLAEEGYVGPDVHFAARVASSGHGGQVILSSATASFVEHQLTDLGEHRLKDIEQAVSVYQLGEESFPPLKTISNTNLPRPASSFLGREAELQEVLSRIAQEARLVTLTGPGGTGKTRLALEAASTLVPEYKAGVFWVGLASLRDPALVIETIAHVLGAKDDLASHIAEREMLLLLDNLEQVIDCAPELSQLLSACPNLALLATSRELLRISGEVEYPVPPLVKYDAVALFCARSQLEASEDIAELCARLDSLPLAVELAAARTKALTPGQILERLSGRLDLLRGGRDADPRQVTLRATIEWSYDLLSPEEQELFARLSVFAGGCTLGAAEEVCEADLDSLQSLVEKSLLRFTDGRYWMLETIREYATERLDESGAREELRAQHGEWVAALAAESEPDWYGPESSTWIARFEAEIANVRAAVEWCIANDPRVALLIISNIWYFWGQTDRSREARRSLESAWIDDLDAQERLRALRLLSALAMSRNDSAAVIEASHERLELAQEVGDEHHQSAAMGMLASALYEAGDVVGAREWFEEAIAFDHSSGRPSGSLGNLGRMERNEGNLDRSRELLEADLRNSRELGNEIDIAWALKELASTALEQDAVSEACELTEEALDIAARVGLTHIAADLVYGVAMLGSRAGKPNDAAKLFGFGDAANEREGFEVLPSTGWWWKLHDDLLAALGVEEFEQLRALGRALDDDQAVTDARLLLEEVRAAASID